jgi:Mce-associated membrane protein
MTQRRSVNWSRVLVYGLLPGLALLLAMAAGLLKWKDSSIRDIDLLAANQSRRQGIPPIAVLTFRYDTVDRDVAAARDRLTGGFLDTYTQRTQQELIPNAKQRRVIATASVPAAAPESVTANHAVVLLFVTQTVRIGDAPAADTESSVRVTLDKIGDALADLRFRPVLTPRRIR